jgi:hypothetical protein
MVLKATQLSMKDFQKKVFLLFTTIFFIFQTQSSKALIFQSIASGAFTAGTSWNQGALFPQAGDTIIVQNGHTITLSGYNTEILGSVTIQAGGNLTIANAAVASLNFSGDLVVYGTLINNGRLDMVAPGNFVLGNGAVYDHNPRINISADESVFENGVENFFPASTLIIRKWASAALPLIGPTRVNGNGGNIGNLITSVTGTPWEQRGRFSPDKIKGNLTVLDGILRMDDGSGATSILTLNNVTIRGNSAIIFQEGNNRNLTLTTGSFTDSSTLTTQATIIMNQSLGTLNLTVNGNFITTHDFIAVYDSTFPVRSATANVTINGNLMIQGTGNKFDFCKQVHAPLTLNVTGNTMIQGNPAYVRFVDSGTGFLNFSTTNLIVSGGLKNVLLGGNEFLDASNNPLFPLPTNYATVNITDDFQVSGNSNTTIMLATGNVNKTKLLVGKDYNSSATTAIVTVAKSIGPVTVSVGRNMLLNGGTLDVQSNNSSNAIDSVLITQNFTFNSTLATNYFRANSGAGNTVVQTNGDFSIINSGTATTQGVCGTYLNNGSLDFLVGGDFTINNGAFYGIQDGTGLNTFVVNGSFNQTGGFFKGTHSPNIITSGKSKFTLGAFNFTGGNFIQYNAANDSVICKVNGNFNVNYNTVSDFVSFIPYVHPVYSNTSPLSLTVTGSMTFGGANGTFYSSVSQGNELISITSNLTFNNGNNSFNLFPNSVINTSHSVNITIGGDLSCNNGINYLSAGRGDLTGTVNGNMNVTGGTISLKGNAADNPVNFNVKGGYNQSNGFFYFHNNTTVPPITTNVYINSDDDNNGNFVQSGGTINVVNNMLNSNDMKLIIKSPNYTIGPGGVIMRNGAGTTNARGTIEFARTGTTLFTRVAGHNLSHAVINILGGTTVEVISGDVQISSYVEEFVGHNLPMLDIKANGTLTLRNNSQVYTTGNNPKCLVVVNSNARLRLQHINGLYSGFSAAALNSSGNMNYILFASSTIEYFGDDNQSVTGIGMGTATTGNQKYGILEINFGGDPATEYVYPTINGTVNVRNQLKLTAGQLRLDDDNNPATGGRGIIIENNANTGITRTAGYIRAETYDGSSIVKWMFGANTTAHVFPFGIDASTYIPVTITSTSGTAGDVSVSTYKTSPANLPLPPAVGHVNSVATGNDNSAECVDRFWKINRSGTSTAFNVIFSAPVAEFPASAGPYKAQHYNYVGGFWDNPFQGAQSYVSAGVVRTVTANALTTMNDWWVLVNQNVPLPVELLSFNVTCSNKKHLITWTTASELNNDYFTIEKSYNGHDFTSWKKVKGNGTTTSPINYEVVNDESAIATYYRLKQFDFDGKMSELKTVYTSSCSNDGFKLLTVNQSDEYINSVITSPENGTVEFSVFDMKGSLIYQSQQTVSSGISTVKLPSNLSKGLYYLQAVNENHISEGRKFVVN